MKTSSPSLPQSAGRFTAVRPNAALNAMSLQSLQGLGSSLPLQESDTPNQVALMQDYPTNLSGSNQRSKSQRTQIVPTVEVTFGPDPQVLIQRAISKVSNPALRTFLRTVMAERDVNRVLTLLLSDGRKLQRLPIDRLRAAAETARNRSMLDARSREILYTAVLISGIESLLGETVEPPYDSQDVIRSVVREAMRRLDQQDEDRACALRNFLGWGNDDESGETSVQQTQYTVRHAVNYLRSNRIPARQKQYA